MYAHRNTITYRLGKIQSILKEDLDDPELRMYLLLSMMILEMQQSREEAGENREKCSERKDEESGTGLPAGCVSCGCGGILRWR